MSSPPDRVEPDRGMRRRPVRHRPLARHERGLRQTRCMARSPHDLRSADIVLGHFTLGRSYPLRERLAIAAEAGVAGVGLFMGDIERWATDDELAAMLDEYGLLLVDLDLINLAALDESTRVRSDQFVQRAVELTDRFGCRY